MWVIPCEKDNFETVHLENQFFGPKPASYTPWGASGPNLAFASHLGGHFCPRKGLGVSEVPKISNKLLISFFVILLSFLHLKEWNKYAFDVPKKLHKEFHRPLGAIFE